MLIFEHSRPGRCAAAQLPPPGAVPGDIPAHLLRNTPVALPEVSELDVVRHYTRLSQKNFSIDTNFYPLGSCTMKYNPRACNTLAMLNGFVARHPYAPESLSQGFLSCMYELQEMLADVTGMQGGVSLTPMAGAQGEFAGVAMIMAYHRHRGDTGRTEIIVPDAAHGTNPATATMCGASVREIPTLADGDIDIEALKAVLGPATAGIMLTNPSTIGVFERRIQEIARLVHAAGGLLYYDGANLNAILGKVRPGDMGFDAIHMNLHKTFSTPHGGGGPGAGAVGVSERLKPFLPIPIVEKHADGRYGYARKKDRPLSIGRLSTFAGNAGVLLRAYIYARLLGSEGMRRVAEYATLNANYLAARLRDAGYTLAYPRRRASHEFIVTVAPQKKTSGVTALDFSKALLDYGIHAPTNYFPLLVPECLLIEPTETESKDTLDQFVAVMTELLAKAGADPEALKQAPRATPVRRLDDVKAVKELDVAWRGAA
ncbi:aminomethyl-transferring glycine dehydrogenase subunit GcvPB [Metallibacterium scheffleri]|jgi:glycine dehydrogenase subunit 2|uniref:aminomethyl-transferring glycine dehydrogenase subunit GcvPB n=1 Tax=Metallibacterium scheffleri TaxID=993689 RepID=UPI0026EECA73|nr:aminomethyl-transferring glycine dehydrogenase subunit GcvPB [Metallibacterium scheffleri]MBW8074485.1 aminotransferase class V-fold PLP-dependent enzyme [Metallibacterium scheffleri]